MVFVIELEPEVEEWLDSLSDRAYGRVMAYADLLAEAGDLLGEPYSRHLGGQVRELRIPLHPIDVRVTYWLALGRRVVLLTVFRKTQRREVAEVERECEASHGHAQRTYDREIGDE